MRHIISDVLKKHGELNANLGSNAARETIVKEIIDTEKITAVFRNSAVILSDTSIDITQKVVDELNKKLSSVKVDVAP